MSTASVCHQGSLSTVKVGGMTMWFVHRNVVAFQLPSFSRPMVRKAQHANEAYHLDRIDHGLVEYRHEADDFEARLANATWWTGQEVAA